MEQLYQGAQGACRSTRNGGLTPKPIWPLLTLTPSPLHAALATPSLCFVAQGVPDQQKWFWASRAVYMEVEPAYFHIMSGGVLLRSAVQLLGAAWSAVSWVLGCSSRGVLRLGPALQHALPCAGTSSLPTPAEAIELASS